MTDFLVTGASGLLGANFALQAIALGHHVTGVVNTQKLPRAPFAVLQADFSRRGEGKRILEEVRPQVVIHCAAMANIDACESMPQLAERVNAELPGELAEECARMGIGMVHISTDAVFDGTADGAYEETSAPNPLSVYARTKLRAETFVLQANPAALVARVNFYGWSIGGNRSLGEFFFNHLSAGNTVRGFTDVFFCTLLVNDLVDILMKMVAEELKGLYHVVSPHCLSKYDFGCLVARQFGLDERLIEPVSWREAGLKAARSPNLRLSVRKLMRDLEVSLPDQEDGMRRFYQLYCEDYPRRLREML
ncbi:MAG: SDR family oxidoreductase [Anaerolineae bacterium]|nr:SDR family oxidoreductase [Anaerolineae bacterium]